MTTNSSNLNVIVSLSRIQIAYILNMWGAKLGACIKSNFKEYIVSKYYFPQLQANKLPPWAKHIKCTVHMRFEFQWVHRRNKLTTWQQVWCAACIQRPIFQKLASEFSPAELPCHSEQSNQSTERSLLHIASKKANYYQTCTQQRQIFALIRRNR